MEQLLIRFNRWIGREVVWRIYLFLGGASMTRRFMLLRTKGRKTGKVRTLIISYLRENTTFLIVASNAGQAFMRAWYHNLQAHPQAEIQLGNKCFQVDAQTIQLDERERLWATWLKQYPSYEDAQKKTTRRFPLVRLTPREKRGIAPS